MFSKMNKNWKTYLLWFAQEHVEFRFAVGVLIFSYKYFLLRN